MEANRTYGSLGELAIMVLPQSQILPLIRKFELGKTPGGKYTFFIYFQNYEEFLELITMMEVLIYVCIGIQGSTGTKENTSVNPIPGIHDGDIMASIKDPHIKEIVAKESLQYKPNPKGGEGPEVSEENKKALSNLLEVRFLM